MIDIIAIKTQELYNADKLVQAEQNLPIQKKNLNLDLLFQDKMHLEEETPNHLHQDSDHHHPEESE